MIIYILDKINLEKKDVIETTSFTLDLDEETNATSLIKLFRKPNAEQGDFILIKDKEKTVYQGIVQQLQGEKNSNQVEVSCLDISNIFDRKIYVDNLELMETSLEDFIYYTIQKFFKNGDNDSKIALNYLTIIQETSTNVKQSTNAENGLYNFHTFITNCRQNKDIAVEYKLTENDLILKIKNIQDNNVISIDTTNNDVINYTKTYELDITAKVTVVCGDTGNILNYYLLTDRSITTNKDDPNRADGTIETLYVEEELDATEQATNIFKGNRYKHLVEFEIKKDSNLINVDDLYIGRNIRIKTNDEIIESYISSMSISNTSNYIKYKSGNIRVNLIDKLKQTPYQVTVDKVDKASIKNEKSYGTTNTYSCDYINQIGGGSDPNAAKTNVDNNFSVGQTINGDLNVSGLFNKIKTEQITSNTDTYSCNYINDELNKLIVNNKILWSSTGSYMNTTQSAQLNEKISSQKFGIVLAFSPYVSGTAQNYDWNFVYIPKEFINIPGTGMVCKLFSSCFDYAGTKYIYIYDTYLQGASDNTKTGTGGSGIKYNNSYWVMRYVIGI